MNRRPRTARRGATTVEMALAAPILFLLIFGAVEFSRMNMLRNTLRNACFEGARRGSLPGATAGEAQSAAQSILNAVGVKQATITVAPSTITDSTATVAVSISVLLSANAWVTPRFTAGKNLTRTCELDRQFVEP